MRGFLILGRRLSDYLDKLTDSLTTFRLLLYILLFYLAAAAVLAHEGKFVFTPEEILKSAAVLVAISKLANLTLAKIFSVPANHESDIITGLILAFILTPAANLNGYLILAAAAAVAMASKYVLSLRGRHVFNPAAFGAFVAGFVFHQYASWWIGATAMAPLLLIGGFLIVRKMRRFEPVLLFIAAYLVYQWILAPLLFGTTVPDIHRLYLDIIATPVLFFASIMLTEPLTSPNKQRNLLIFSLIVAIMYSVVKLQRPPEEALLLGNVLAFALEPNRSLLLKLIGRRREADQIFSFIFQSPLKLKFQAGQYMEWTLPRTGIDARGNRRYLTIASAPTERELMFTVKVPTGHSKFKDALMNLAPGQKIAAQRLAGDFTLADDGRKVALIAGGVGITPFRSMIKDLVDRNASRDIVLLYSVNNAQEIAFKSLFDQAGTLGVNTKYVVTKGDEPDYLHGFIDKELIKNNLPDYKDRLFYISGPQGFVAAVRLGLLELGVLSSSITTDFFPGYN
jgi:ferredoxin-NADP reductase/Na+-translocating ferredoxin:NAD+ oxidoreductase RnfD subunit